MSNRRGLVNDLQAAAEIGDEALKAVANEYLAKDSPRHIACQRMSHGSVKIRRTLVHHAGTILPITTNGSIRRPLRAWVYIADAGLGLIKIGMSGGPKSRCKRMGVLLYVAIEVTPAAARHVETEALRLLRRRSGDGEWVEASCEEGLAAVRRAKEIVGGYMHVDPEITPEESRQRRIRNGALNGENESA